MGVVKATIVLIASALAAAYAIGAPCWAFAVQPDGSTDVFITLEEVQGDVSNHESFSSQSDVSGEADDVRKSVLAGVLPQTGDGAAVVLVAFTMAAVLALVAAVCAAKAVSSDLRQEQSGHASRPPT